MLISNVVETNNDSSVVSTDLAYVNIVNAKVYGKLKKGLFRLLVLRVKGALCLTKQDEVNTLLERSRRFYESALFQIEKGFYDLAMFSFEQSLQLFLKAALLSLGVDYLRTHSVRRLLELVHELTGSNDVEKLLLEYSVELALLEDAYITSRYVPRDFRAEEVLRVKEAVDRVLRVVREALGKTSQAQS